MKPLFRCLLLLLTALPLFSICQTGFYSSPMELSRMDAQRINRVVWDGLKKGDFLAYYDHGLQKALTYDDACRIFDLRNWSPKPLKTVKISVLWSGKKNSIQAFGIAPVYANSDKTVYFCLADVSANLEEEFRLRLFQIIGKHLKTYINDQNGTSKLVQDEDQTIQKLDLNNTSDLYLLPLNRLPKALFAGLLSGKYYAFPSPKLEQVFNRKNTEKVWQSVSELNPEDVESLLIYESWGKASPSPIFNISSCVVNEQVEQVRKLDGIGTLFSDGRIVYFQWSDVRQYLSETGAWFEEEPLSSKQNLEEANRLYHIDQATVFRLYFRSAFAEKMGVEFLR